MMNIDHNNMMNINNKIYYNKYTCYLSCKYKKKLFRKKRNVLIKKINKFTNLNQLFESLTIKS